MRGLLEDELESKKRVMQSSTKDANLQLSRNKKDKERYEKNQKLREEDSDLLEQRTIREVPSYMNPLE